MVQFPMDIQNIGNGCYDYLLSKILWYLMPINVSIKYEVISLVDSRQTCRLLYDIPGAWNKQTKKVDCS